MNVTCENEGVCMNNATAQSYYCDCVGNYTGVHCEQCLTLTCENGGVCSNNATSGENTCTCAEGYSGSTCQSEYTSCEIYVYLLVLTDSKLMFCTPVTMCVIFPVVIDIRINRGAVTNLL